MNNDLHAIPDCRRNSVPNVMNEISCTVSPPTEQGHQQGLNVPFAAGREPVASGVVFGSRVVKLCNCNSTLLEGLHLKLNRVPGTLLLFRSFMAKANLVWCPSFADTATTKHWADFLECCFNLVGYNALLLFGRLS